VIRDVIGNPFHPTTFKPAWQTQKVVGLARAIYDGRSFERMLDLGVRSKDRVATTPTA